MKRRQWCFNVLGQEASAPIFSRVSQTQSVCCDGEKIGASCSKTSKFRVAHGNIRV
jgi:hypothetical protein